MSAKTLKTILCRKNINNKYTFGLVELLRYGLFPFWYFDELAFYEIWILKGSYSLV